MYGPSKEPGEPSLQNQSIDNVQVQFAILEYSFTFSRMRWQRNLTLETYIP